MVVIESKNKNQHGRIPGAHSIKTNSFAEQNILTLLSISLDETVFWLRVVCDVWFV